MNQSIKTDIEAKATRNSIYFIGGEKGGVGKSFFARCLVDYFVTKGWKNEFVLIEGDPTINDVGCVFKDNHEQVKFSDDRFLAHEPNVIVDGIEKKSSIVNLPSNVMKEFDSWIDTAGVFSLKEQYIENMTYFFVSDGCWRSVELFMRQIEKYDLEKLPHCLVLNKGRLTNEGNFSYLERYCPEFIETLKVNQIPIIYLPTIPHHLQFVCDRANLAYSDLVSKPKEEVKRVLEEAYQQGNSGEIMAKKLTALGCLGSMGTFIKQTNRIFKEIFSKNIKTPDGLSKIAQRQAEDLKQGKLPFHE